MLCLWSGTALYGTDGHSETSVHHWRRQSGYQISECFGSSDATSELEGIRKRAVNLYKKNWTIEFKWVKAHARIHGNEIADRLAKDATQNY